jgi:hypothetical protein
VGASSFVACGSDESSPNRGGQENTDAGSGGSGGSGAGGSAGSSGRSSTGGRATSGGNGGSSAGSGGTSTGGAAAGGAATGGASGGASDCTTDPPSGAPAGSCDTRQTTGTSAGQCREWFGSSTIDLSVSCNGLGGVFGSAPCAPEERVGRCVLDPVLGVVAVYNYYASNYTESTARVHCGRLRGCMLAPGNFSVVRAGAGSGQVDITPPGVTCGGTVDDPLKEPCSHSFTAGEVVTLVAKPDAMSTFSGWSGGGCSTATTCQVTVSGPVTVTANFAPTTMKTPFAWTFGGPSMNADGVSRVAIGPSGGLFFEAQFEASATFDGKALTAGLRDVLIARLDPSTGTIPWFHQLGGPEYDNPGDLVLDNAGRVIATGFFWRAMTINGQSYDFASPSTVLMKLDPATGAFTWVRAITGTGMLELGHLAIDPNDDIVAAGYTDDTLSDSNVMVSKRSGADGSEIWRRVVGGSDRDVVYGVASDTSGDVYVIGEYVRPIDFGGGALPATASRNAFAAKLRGTDGSHVWSVRRHDGGLGGGVAVNSAGLLFVAAQSGTTARAARLSPTDGSEQWSKAVSFAPTLDLSTDGNPIVTSELRTTFDPGGGILVGRGWHDIMVTELAASDGAHQRSIRLGGAGFDSFGGIAPVAPGDFYVGGGFQNSLEVVGRTLTSNGGSGDGLIVRVQP